MPLPTLRGVPTIALLLEALEKERESHGPTGTSPCRMPTLDGYNGVEPAIRSKVTIYENENSECEDGTASARLGIHHVWANSPPLGRLPPVVDGRSGKKSDEL